MITYDVPALTQVMILRPNTGEVVVVKATGEIAQVIAQVIDYPHDVVDLWGLVWTSTGKVYYQRDLRRATTAEKMEYNLTK